MRHFSYPSALQALTAVATMVLLASCTTGEFSSIAPSSEPVNAELRRNHVSFYACPATGFG